MKLDPNECQKCHGTRKVRHIYQTTFHECEECAQASKNSNGGEPCLILAFNRSNDEQSK